MDRRALFGRLAAASGLLALATGGRAAAATGTSPNTVYHLSESDRIAFVLGNLKNHFEVGHGLKLALVVHGPPLRDFGNTTASAAVKSATAELKAKGLDLYACIHTLNAFHLTTADLLPGFVVAEQGGVVKLAELQGQGWAYLRP